MTTPASNPDSQNSVSTFYTRLTCVDCLVRQAREAIVLVQPHPEVAKRALREALALLAEADWRLSPPALAQANEHVGTACDEPCPGIGGQQPHRLVHTVSPFIMLDVKHEDLSLL